MGKKAQDRRRATPATPTIWDRAVKTDIRICFGLAYFDSEQEAEQWGARIRKSGASYNGGYFHGKPCGREPQFDHDDQETGRRLYAVSM